MSFVGTYTVITPSHPHTLTGEEEGRTIPPYLKQQRVGCGQVVVVKECPSWNLLQTVSCLSFDETGSQEVNMDPTSPAILKPHLFLDAWE